MNSRICLSGCGSVFSYSSIFLDKHVWVITPSEMGGLKYWPASFFSVLM